MDESKSHPRRLDSTAKLFIWSTSTANRARGRLVRLAKKLDVGLRQSYARVGKLALIGNLHRRYRHILAVINES